MSVGTNLITLFFASCFVCCFSQYVQYPYNYGYPVSTGYGYGSPCQSPCGSVQPSSRCPYLPCYQQSQQYPQYYPYANSYNYNGNSNRRVVNPYSYLYPGRYSTSSNQYGNIPVEIIDDVSVGTQKVGKLPPVGKVDPYADVKVEIIDDDGYADFWRTIPKLPKVTQSSSSNYSASQGGFTSNSTSYHKPVRAVITRTFQPLKKNPIINLNFVNGGASENKPENEGEEVVVTTTEQDGTTEENEDVSAVTEWLLKH